ncbi:protein FAM229A isoform X1 [Delphinapterus leucas]|uniref:Protein FAM229A isoform X1 n=1 Tax=Delphinapterus leucas TaxID=9749 RepID=A0A2Y9ND00_DELLE|nr:protein FAM229A isoform X1 [Delphinapterus leucas]
MPGSFPWTQPPAPPTGSWGSARPMARALQVPARAALSAGAAWGSPAGGTGSIRSARQGPGHNAALPLDARAPGAPQTPARLRLDRSVLSRPGLGQLLPAWDRSRPPAGKRRPTGRARGGGARRPASCLTATPAQSASDMSAQEPPQGRRFPIEAGDSPGLAFPRETQDSPERVATEHNPVRPLRRCPGWHCLTLLHVPIDVYLALGGSPRVRAT